MEPLQQPRDPKGIEYRRAVVVRVAVGPEADPNSPPQVGADWGVPVAPEQFAERVVRDGAATVCEEVNFALAPLNSVDGKELGSECADGLEPLDYAFITVPALHRLDCALVLRNMGTQTNTG